MKTKFKIYLARYLKVTLIVTLLASLAGYLGELNLYLELISHFKAQYLFASLILLVLSLALRLKSWAIVGMLALLINAYDIAPLYLSTPAGLTAAETKPTANLKIVQSNVFIRNSEHSRLIEYVKNEDADILTTIEVDAKWSDSLNALSTHLPYKKVIAKHGPFGIALFSRYPLKDVKSIELGKRRVPAISAKITVNGKELHMLVVHTVPPVNKEFLLERNRELFEAASLIADLPEPKILIGDLNTTMWSPYFKDFINETGLISSRDGYGILATWPTDKPPLMMPLDHCLVSPDIKVVDIFVGPNIGSDHLPLVIKLAI